MSDTENLGLHLTGETAQDKAKTFLAWRKEINGTGNDSNMNIIDAAIGDLDDLATTAKGNLVAAINEAAQSGSADVKWSDVKDKPSAFPPSSHTHAISSVEGLSDALSGKADNSAVEALAARIKPYTALEKVKPCLYHAGYSALDYDYARNYFDTHGSNVSGACAAVRNGNFYGRNFDWTYDNGVEFVVRTARSGNRFASIGIAGGGELVEASMSGNVDEAMRIVPFYTRDGINEYGLTVSTLVVPNEGHTTVSVPTVEQRDRINGIMLTRYILDHFKTAHEACDYIGKYVSVWFSSVLHDMGYEQHYMIADAESTVVLEFVDDAAVEVNVGDAPYVTNFFVNGVQFNDDGTVYTPATLANGSPTEDNLITAHGSGLERYNQIVDGYASTTTAAGMRALMNSLKYTRAYSTSATPSNPYWYTEFVSGDLHCDSPVVDFADIVAEAGTAYSTRTRDDANTWQTVHSVVYDMAARTMNLVVQEDGVELTFGLGDLFERMTEAERELAVVSSNLETKVDKQQAVADAGKVLTIGSDGIVAPNVSPTEVVMFNSSDVTRSDVIDAINNGFVVYVKISNRRLMCLNAPPVANTVNLRFGAVDYYGIYCASWNNGGVLALGNFGQPQTVSNKVTSLSSTSTDTKYPSAKCVYDFAQPRYTTQTITISADAWSNNTVTVNVTGVTADNLVQLTVPTKADMDKYGQAGVFCSAQGAGTLTFTCVYTPTDSITVNAVIWG